MKAAISKEQSTELRKWLEKQRLPKETVDMLLNSSNAGNTYKAFRQKKQITTIDGWAIHFGANMARQLEKDEVVKADDIQADEEDIDVSDSGSVDESETEQETKSKNDPDDIKAAGDTVVSRTFMGLAEKLKNLKIEDVDKPQMQKIAFEIDKDHLAMLKKYATVKGQGATVGSLIRDAIRQFLESI